MSSFGLSKLSFWSNKFGLSFFFFKSKMMTNVHWDATIAWNRLNAVTQRDRSDVKNQDQQRPQLRPQQQQQLLDVRTCIHNMCHHNKQQVTRNHTVAATMFGCIRPQPIQDTLNTINDSDHATKDSPGISKALAWISTNVYKIIRVDAINGASTQTDLTNAKICFSVRADTRQMMKELNALVFTWI